MVGVTWKGSRSKSMSSAAGSSFRAASQPPPAAPTEPVKPAVTFKDKQSYQDLFKPLPKPEPLPDLKITQIDCKSWSQLQKEREDIVNKEIERTRHEANSLYQRVLQDDKKRVDMIEMEQQRIKSEQEARELILKKEREERRVKDEERKEEIRRQEQILANSRNVRSKTVDVTADHRGSFSGPPGIRVYHYKDQAVPEIVKQTRQEEIRRKNSLAGFNILSGSASTESAGTDYTDTSSIVFNAVTTNNDTTNGFNGVNGVTTNGLNGEHANNWSASSVNADPSFSYEEKQDFARNGAQQGMLPVSKLPPRPIKDTMISRKFQNGVDSAFGVNNGVNDFNPNNIYKSVMNGKRF